jgi:hypothetical protein
MSSIGGTTPTPSHVYNVPSSANPITAATPSQAPVSLTPLTQQEGAGEIAQMMTSAQAVAALSTAGPAATLDLSSSASGLLSGSTLSTDVSSLLQGSGMYQLVSQGGSQVVNELMQTGNLQSGQILNAAA